MNYYIKMTDKNNKKKNKLYNGILDWMIENKIKNEKGGAIEFDNHPFLLDIYDDQSQLQVIMKPAQVGLSTLAIIKNHADAKQNKMDIIYTLPTDSDVNTFVSGKVNRIIANNKCMLEDVADKDSIQQKQVDESMIYFRGTWTKKAAIMVTADRLVHDEKDSSKLDIIADYQARIQHSKFKQTHTFSHPSLPETGVHADYLQSDQKHWFVKCPHCNHWQFLSWDLENEKKMSIDMELEQYVCKKCHGVLEDWVRSTGQWVAKYKDKEWSGYWISQLFAPYISAKEIIKDFRKPETTAEFFYTKKLGLPYADATAKLLRESFFQNLTGKMWNPSKDERVIIGIDTGLRLDYVIGNKKGLFYQGDCDDYRELDALMLRWPKAVAVIDSGGDLIGSRAFASKWKGRVYICYLTGDKNKNELMSWGKGDEHGSVTADRNRMIQLVIDEFRTKRIPVHGTEADWYEYYVDWNSLSKLKILDPDTRVVKGYKWVRSGRDHRALATIFWRVGMARFAGMGAIIVSEHEVKPNSYMVEPNQTVKFDPEKLFDLIEEEQEQDWRL